MRIGIGNTVPERSNLPGQSGGGGVVIPLIISYSASAFCANASDPTPTVTGNVGAGTYSSTAGLVFVSTSTGEVDISASTPSATAYVITYTDTNSATATFNLTINALDNAAFSYTYSSYAQNFPDPTPTITGLAGGTFSGSTGLVINSTTGEIDLDASTIAAHTITYDTTSSGSSVCPNTSTQTVDIVAALAQVNNVYSMGFDGSSDYVTMGNVLNTSSTGASAFSMSCWFKTSASGGTYCLISKAKNSGQLDGYQFLVNSNGEIRFFLGRYTGNSASSPWVYVKTTTTWNDGNWHNAVLTYNGNQNTSGLTLYVDGNPEPLATVFNNTPSINSTDSEFMIGARGKSGDVGGFFEGKIDEVSFFNVELTAQEAQSIYLATETGKTADLNDLTTPPIKWYRMGD